MALELPPVDSISVNHQKGPRNMLALQKSSDLLAVDAKKGPHFCISYMSGAKLRMANLTSRVTTRPNQIPLTGEFDQSKTTQLYGSVPATFSFFLGGQENSGQCAAYTYVSAHEGGSSRLCKCHDAQVA